jgi:alpha-ketoglutarate-dependent taurine dioxygenase
MTEPAPSNQTGDIDVRPLSVHIGAEITGVDIATPFSEATASAIRDALLRWKVVFFRDQNLDHESHVQFARRFGRPTPAHIVFGGDAVYPEIYPVAKHRAANAGKDPVRRSWTGWHTDITAAVNPPAASILRGVTVPPYGGDTYWTNLAVAYDRLSGTLQGFLDGLRAVHRFNAPVDAKAAGDYTKRVGDKDLAAEHPLVTVHPETGERVLYVSPDFVKGIVGLAPRESQALLELLWEHAVQTEFTVRFKWEPGSVAFWDNRATAHLAPTDIFATDYDRQFYRVTLAGEAHVGVDGSRSTALSGDPIPAL